jgi:putative endonuclease
MPAYVYVLRSAATGQHFIGSTRNLQERIARHNDSYEKVIRPGVPWECVYVEVCDSMDAARNRERHLKSLEGVDEKIQILYSTPWRSREE